MEAEFLLPIGFNLDGVPVKKMSIADTGGDAEKVYKSPSTSANLYTWFGRVIAVSVKSINGMPVAVPFISKMDSTDEVPAVIQKLPLSDVGSLILQIQRSCWQQVIKDQQIACKFCGKNFNRRN